MLHLQLDRGAVNGAGQQHWPLHTFSIWWETCLEKTIGPGRSSDHNPPPEWTPYLGPPAASCSYCGPLTGPVWLLVGAFAGVAVILDREEGRCHVVRRAADRHR